MVALSDRWRDRHVRDTVVVGLLSVALYAAFPPFSDIYRLWRKEAGLGIYGGLGQGEFEYPPLAALYFEPLSHFPSSRWAVVVHGLLMVIVAVLITRILLELKDRSNAHVVDVRMWAMSPALLLFLPINWDVLAVLLALVGVVALRSQRSITSGTLLGAGVSLKVFHGALVLPFLPLIEGWRERLRFLGSGLVILIVSYAVYIAVFPETWDLHLDFAASRADFESTVWGVLDWIGGPFGAGLSLAAVNVVSTAAFLGAIVALTVWVWLKRPTLVQVALLALIAFVLFNKVFKPQYLLWLLPFLAWNGSSRPTVRLLEFTAIAHIAVTYFPLPSVIVEISAAVRTVVLVSLGVATIRAATPHVREPQETGLS